MSQTKSEYPFVYNPSNYRDADLKSNFVVRIKEFNDLFDAIKKDKIKNPPQHYIIQGQRGYGKTTLLLRLNLEIKNDLQLQKWLIPVLFDEEQYGIRTLAKLWEEVIVYLAERNECFNKIKPLFDSLYEKEFPEEELFNQLIKCLNKDKKKIILFIDNFGELVQKFNKKEIQRLREILNTCNAIRIIGASAIQLEFSYDYKHPFYEFFKIIILNELNKEESILLMERIAKTYGKSDDINNIIKEQPERIESLRLLTGGVPRTIVLLFQIFIDSGDGNSFKDLEEMLDRVTPLYKDRLDNLSDQQQAIIDAIALNWDAMSTKEISKKIRLSSKSVSSQLNLLEKNQVITKVPSSTKNYLYRINERFFNIYYLMRIGNRKNKSKVLWLVEFFKIWYGTKELKERIQTHIKAIKENKMFDKCAFYVTQALAEITDSWELQHEVITEARKYLLSKESDLAKELPQSHFEIIDVAIKEVEKGDIDNAICKMKNDNIPDNIIFLTIANIMNSELKNFEEAIYYYNKAIQYGTEEAMYNLALLYEEEYKDYQKAEQYYLMAIKKEHILSMNNLASLYANEYNDNAKAEKYYLMAIKKNNIISIFNLALFYEKEYKDYAKAEKYYLMAIDKNHVESMYNLSLLYIIEYKDYKKAEKYCLMAIERGYVNAMFNLALLYHIEYKDSAKAEKYYLMAIENDQEGAMNNLALLYENEYKDYDKAERYHLMAIEKDYVYSMFNLALLYENQYKDYDKAERYYLMAVEKDHIGAMYNLGLLYLNTFKAIPKAEKYFLMASEKGEGSATFNLALLYENRNKDYSKAEKYYLLAIEKNHIGAMNNLGLLYEKEHKDYSKAEKYLLMAIEKGSSTSMFNLALLYEKETKDYSKAEKYYLMAIEKGYSKALNNLAHLYLRLTKNKKNALELYEEYSQIGRAYV